MNLWYWFWSSPLIALGTIVIGIMLIVSFVRDR